MKRPSITSVARRAGVSTATVSRIVNGNTGRASEETVRRVHAVIAETGYRPSSAGQSLRRQESRLIAVIAANLANPSMASMAASVEISLREIGLVTVLCDSHDRPDLQDEYLLEMGAHAVRGFVFLGAVKSAVLERLVSADEALVFVNRRNPFNRDSAFVGIDNSAAATEIARMLHDRAISRTLVIHGPLASSATAERLDALRTFFAPRLEMALAIRGSDSLDHLSIGQRHTANYLAEFGHAPQAIVGMSDLIAYGAARTLREASDTAPRDCVLIGFDDNPLNEWIAPWLTSVRIPYEGFGPVVVNSMTRIWTGERNFSSCLPYSLIKRNR